MSGYHPSLTSAVAASHHGDLVKAAEQHRLATIAAGARSRGHIHIRRVRPQWWTRLVTRTSSVRLAQA